MSISENLTPHLPLVYDPLAVYQTLFPAAKPSNDNGEHNGSESRLPTPPPGVGGGQGQVDVYA